MSSCSWNALIDEWRRSVSRLSDLIGEQVTVASVPGGFYSTLVARAASSCGIRALFTSEPIKKCDLVDECIVLGRFRVGRGMSPVHIRALCSAPNSAVQMKQFALWNLMKAGKFTAGKYYPGIRAAFLQLSTKKASTT
jgi:hypothetical protein